MSYHQTRAESMKELRRFIIAHPEGVTHKDIEAAGLSVWGLSRLQKLGAIKGEQVREPERGPRNYHWLYKPSEIKDA